MIDLNNLSLREKILIFIFLAVFAFFLAFKSYEFLFDFAANELNIDEQNIYNQKIELSNLKAKQKELQDTLLKQTQTINSYNKQINKFKYNYEEYIKEIEILAKKYNIIFEDIQNSRIEFNYIQKYNVFLIARGDFKNLLEFLLALENSKFYFNIKNINIENLKSINLELKLMLDFASLK
ncbi:hypothetical protein [Campylobacter sp. TTU_617]|uniref:hypothetical protein n=1 Tax=Campylobacter sp. TTU_617 TaxID=2768148 RepID=UPI0019065083|nr:hypothetical protein [Campylobacter sp. TTU_617]MBK1971996.1 hypothetical protein [Campylobacter sp. TTU_617]